MKHAIQNFDIHIFRKFEKRYFACLLAPGTIFVENLQVDDDLRIHPKVNDDGEMSSNKKFKWLVLVDFSVQTATSTFLFVLLRYHIIDTRLRTHQLNFYAYHTQSLGRVGHRRR